MSRNNLQTSSILCVFDAFEDVPLRRIASLDELGDTGVNEDVEIRSVDVLICKIRRGRAASSAVLDSVLNPPYTQDHDQ